MNIEKLEVKAYTNDELIVLDASGISAVMHLLNLLWQDKTNIHLAKIAYNQKEQTITIKTNSNIHYGELTYIFKNAPIQWDGNIDTAVLHKAIYNEMKEVM